MNAFTHHNPVKVIFGADARAFLEVAPNPPVTAEALAELLYAAL